MGGLTLTGPGGLVAGRVARPRQLAVLARLAVTSTGVVSRDTLVGSFWPEKPEAQARHLLADVVYLLRKELGEDAVVAVGDDLGLDPRAVSTDVEAFERALDEDDPKRAVELYGGAFLDGFFLPRAPRFERWVDEQRGRLSRRFAGALEHLAEAAEARGQSVRAVEWWEKRAAEDPFDSRVARSLMSAYAASGNLAKALQHARDHEERVGRELGLELAPQLRSFVDELREQHVPASAPPAGGLPLTGEASDKGGRQDARRGDRRSAPVAEPVSPPAGLFDRVVNLSGRPWVHRRRAILGSVALLLLASLATAMYLAGRSAASEGGLELASIDKAGPTKRAVAVLPPDHLGSQASDSAFANGFHRHIISQLSKISALRVTSRTSVLEYRNNSRPTPEIGADLGVDFLVDASIQRSRNTLEVNVQLIDAGVDAVLWSRDYTRELTAENLFNVQSEVAVWIAREIGAQHSPAEAARLASRPTDDLEAWDYFTLGLDYAPRSGPEMREVAISLFERAIDRDPGFALALAHLSMVHTDVFGWGDDRSPQRVERARRAADSAMALAPDLAEARLARGLYEYRGLRDYRRAAQSISRALEVSPGHATALHFLANIQRRLGDFRSARRNREEAFLRDPRNPDVILELVYDYTHEHGYLEATRKLDRGISLTPDLFGTEGPQKHAWIALLSDGDAERARRALQTLFHQAERGETRRLGNLLYYSQPGTMSQAAVVRALGEADRRAVYEAEPDMHPVRRSRSPALRHWARAQLAALDGDETSRMGFLDSAHVTLKQSIGVMRAQKESVVGNRGRLASDYGFLALVLAHMGRRDEALRAAETAVELAEEDANAFLETPLALAAQAQVHTIFEEYDEAIDILERIVPAPSWFSAPLLRVDPIWDQLEGHPRFEALLASASDR